ncbi:unnamed protein product [Rotaria socialis]|uniref:Uncharacterized protein n=1 Tax=Rotaria socialis TaxID=392032 RepID=A0A818B3Y9_9BILA|nr:unnamed protein product [Rotaria socialis]CAF4504526.1 unnamed protein product [Rotaria socialis]
MDMNEHLSNVSESGLPKNKKKKCRGNRKLQRFRRQCYKKGMSTEEIQKLISMKNTIICNEKMNTSSFNCINESQQYHQENYNVGSTIESDIVLPYEKKEALLSLPIRICSKKMKSYNLATDYWGQIIKLIPNYENLSPYQFKHVLTKVIPLCYQNFMEQWLTNFNILEVLQQRAQLMSTVFQLRIEQDYWNYISNLINMPIVIWLSEVGKDFTKQNSINWDHTKTESNIQRRLHIIHAKLQQAEHNLTFHLQQLYLHYGDIQDQFFMVHFIDIITNTLRILVNNNLYYFRTNFEQKKILLHFDTTDAHLTKSFYDLNPTEKQISTVQNIWRAKLKSCKKERHQQKKGNHMPLMMHDIKIQSVHDDQDNQLASIKSYASSMYMIVAARLRNIKQRTQEMMKFVSTIDDDVFF